MTFYTFGQEHKNPSKNSDLLNRCHQTIKFTYESSPTEIQFLDIAIFKGDRYRSFNKLDVKPFFKKRNKFQYLHYSSAHPKKTFRSVLKGEHTRILRGCSDEKEYTLMKDKLYKAFRDRGYPRKLVREVQQSMPHSIRGEMLKEKETFTQPS